MSDIIDQAIDEANEAAKVVEEAGKEPIQQASEEETETEIEQPEDKAEKAEEGADEEEVVFPKKAVNALKRRDNAINRLKAEKRELEAQIAQFKQQRPESKQSSTPNADDYASFDDYLAALVDHRVKGGNEQKPQEPQITQEDVQRQVYFQNRAQEVTKRSDEIATILPDFAQVRDMNADVLDALPDRIIEAVLEADDAPLALYVLAKEGKLESLAQMSSIKAARELALAETKGQQYLQRKQTKAPAPISGKVKPNPNNRGLESMSADELMAWARK